MSDSSARLARAILSRNLRLKKGDSVVIESWSHSLPYTRAFVDEARRLGAQPTVLYEDESAWWNAVAAKRTGPFSHLSSAETAAVGKADAYLYFWGPADMRRAIDLGAFSAKFIGFNEEWYAANEEWYAAARKGGLRGYRMSLGLASDPTAKRFGLAGPAWRERLARAGAVDAHAMLAKGNRVAKRLSDGSELRIQHPNGTDLRISLHGVRPTVASGIPNGATKTQPRGMLEGNPSGQLFAALDGADASGTFVSNRTVFDMAHYDKFAGSRWTFDGGRLTKHSTTVGRDVFEKAFAAAPKGKDRIGYLTIGLNPEARELPPCEDTEEGAILVGVGGNAVAGGRSRNPFTGYALLGGGTLTVDGKPIARGGRIL
jgi:leucyl aminopeptidase (aminopeptidase T)